MPFVLRKVEPRLVCRGHVPQEASPRDWPIGAELEAVANGALTASLKQLASLLTAAEDVFAELTAELAGIADRSGRLRARIDSVEQRLAQQDPKKIPVPESDICTFAARTEHYRTKNEPHKSLFTLESRPKALRLLYEAAAAAAAVRNLDSLRRDAVDSAIDMFMCTPVLGKRRKREQSLDIESRVPRAIEDLRRWTSAEALGDVTVAPNCTSRILADSAVDDSRPVDHKLPSPEEQLQAVALKFPAEVVAVDVSGRGFRRMSTRRRSLMHAGHQEAQDAVKRRSRPRRPRGKRRNTIAGTDQKEIRQAVGGETSVVDVSEDGAQAGSSSKRAHRSASTDLLGDKRDSPAEKKSHFNTLKAWGRSRLKLISPKSSHQNHQDANDSSISATISALSNGPLDHCSLQDKQTQQQDLDQESTARSTEPLGGKVGPGHERKPSSSSSSGAWSAAPGQLPASPSRDRLVRLRESAAERRERRKPRAGADEPPHSSSGNWSASSESGRASVGSETASHPARSTTTASSSTSLSHARRLKGRDTSASSSVTSEGTLTPDIIQDIGAVPFSDDGETSSVYSCDTEGYYTSFHVDSGLKTLREEEPVQPLTKSNELHSDPTSPVAENEYELFGRGSTSTTTSSAGTVCTTLLAPPPPERKSSLTVVAMVHGQNQNGGESPDSGHNTSSSPVESASSPACTGRSCSEFEYSESSDLEGCERIERIRSKTAINTSRIPSMCVITPPGSDDEHHKERNDKQQRKQSQSQQQQRNDPNVLMSATVGTSKMQVINGQDKNLYATVQTVVGSTTQNDKGNTAQKISPLSGVLGKLRGALAGRKQIQQQQSQLPAKSEAIYQQPQPNSGDYVTIADVRNNNSAKRRDGESSITTTPRGPVTYANSDLFMRDAEYVSLSELPAKPDSSLERRRQGARVTLDSEGKVVYSSDSLKRRKGAHTTFIPGPFVKEGPSSPAASPLLRRSSVTPRAVQRTGPQLTTPDATDGTAITNTSIEPSTAPTQPQHQTQQQPQQTGKLIIRAAKSPERAPSPDYVRTPSTVVASSGAQRQTVPARQGAYVNVQGGDGEDKSLVAIQPSETVSTATCPQKQHQQIQYQQPPPYVEPPQVHRIYDNYPYQVMFDNRSQQAQNHLNNGLSSANQQDHHNYSHHDQNQLKYQPQHIVDPYRQLIREKIGSHQPYCNYADNQKMYAHQPVPGYDKSQQQQQFYTLPNRRPQRDITMEPTRSITPDITRGLARAPLSSMHMLARQGQKSVSSERLAPQHHGQPDYNYQADLNRRNLERQFEERCRIAEQQQHRQSPVDVRNRYASPVGSSAIGYRFFASPQQQENLKNATISPIGPEHTNGFRSSTPVMMGVGRVPPTVAERLALQSQRCVSPNPALMQAADSGRNTPAGNNPNIILSPIKSTMSSEELFAAIHKSRKRLNIREDGESLSPAGSVSSLPGCNKTSGQQQDVVGTRHSWSPETQKTPEIPKTVLTPSVTSRMDFKRLLLQQSIKTGPTRISAAEQLKLSRQQWEDAQYQQMQQPMPPAPTKPTPQQTAALSKVLSPRSAWRFQTPRTDVLSSTIIEDTAAEEKAMKPSPDNPPPASKAPFTYGTRKLEFTVGKEERRPLDKSEKELENRLHADEARNKSTEENDPVKAIENRRISNQLARAQFLASNSVSPDPAPAKDLFSRKFRARSESPAQRSATNVSPSTVQAEIGNSVSRSPSAPALETAL